MPSRVSELTDYSTFRDDGTIGLSFSKRISGVRCVLEWVARRWITGRGEYLADSTMVTDLTALENADLSNADLSNLPRVLEAQARRVDFVRRTIVTYSFDGSGQLTINARIDVIGEGEYPLAAMIDQARLAFNFGAV